MICPHCNYSADLPPSPSNARPGGPVYGVTRGTGRRGRICVECGGGLDEFTLTQSIELSARDGWAQEGS